MTTPGQHIDRIIWRNGEFVPWRDATVHVLAQSVQRGTLAFDFMSIHHTPRGAAVFRLSDHIDRLITTCELTGLPLAYSQAELVAACAATVRANPGATAMKISALIASIEAELIPQDPSVSIFIAAYDSATDIIATHKKPPHSRPHLAIKVERQISNRRHDIIPPQAKVAANYTSPLIAKLQARAEGYDDVLLLTEDGLVAEAPTSNIFIVTADGSLVTPPENRVLLGITRSSVIEMARVLNIACEERDLSVDQLLQADEVFLTATSGGLSPVVRVDETVFGNGSPGPVTTRLAETLRRIQAGEDDRFENWLYYVGENGGARAKPA